MKDMHRIAVGTGPRIVAGNEIPAALVTEGQT
jgi:hypothetical protein